MELEILKSKKITLATLKSFINKSSNLFIEIESDFNGMTDAVEKVEKNFRSVSKNEAIGFNGVWCVGGSRNSFKFVENTEYFGIEVYNCCGCRILWTNK